MGFLGPPGGARAPQVYLLKKHRRLAIDATELRKITAPNTDNLIPVKTVRGGRINAMTVAMMLTMMVPETARSELALTLPDFFNVYPPIFDHQKNEENVDEIHSNPDNKTKQIHRYSLN